MSLLAAHQELGQFDLLSQSKLFTEKSGHEQAFSSQLSLRDHEMRVNLYPVMVF